MRGEIRRRHQEDEEESAFVSMTDLTVSFLFIVIILLAFFASQMKDDKTVPRSAYDRLEADFASSKLESQFLRRDLAEREGRIGRLQDRVATLQDRVATSEEALRRAERNPLQIYLSQAADQRHRILTALRDRLRADFPELQGIVSIETDALRFKGDGLFESGSKTLSDSKRRIIESIAARLNEILPCYTLGQRSRWNQQCNDAGVVIEAIQIEGHTDASGEDRNNFTLSTDRAIETLYAMRRREPILVEHMNTQSQPVLSVSGYGKLRPVAENSSIEGRATNRRIDLRIIMYTPQNMEGVEKVRQDLRDGVAGLGLQ